MTREGQPNGITETGGYGSGNGGEVAKRHRERGNCEPDKDENPRILGGIRTKTDGGSRIWREGQ
jgi:hypothetical protein